MSTSGVGSSGYNDTMMLAKVLNWNIKLVPGYRGMQPEMAMRRGEIDAAISSLSSADLFVNNGYGRFIFQVGGTPPKGVPLLGESGAVDMTFALRVIAEISDQSHFQRFVPIAQLQFCHA